MKLIVLAAVVSIAVFRANCGEPPDARDLNHDDRIFSDDSNLPESSGQSNDDDLYYFTDLPTEPKDESTTVEPEDFSSGPVHGAATTDRDMASTTIEFGPEWFQNYNSYDIYRQRREVQKVRNGRKLRGSSKCKSDIICSLLGGACVSNTTYCSGREVESICGGPKCKCCFTVNMEVKMHDFEAELRSTVVNLTVANSNINTKLESLINFMISSNSSQSTVNSNLDKNINSIMSTNSNLTIANSNFNTKLESMQDYMISSNSSQAIVISNLDQKISNLISTNSNLTVGSSNTNTKLDSMKNIVNSFKSSQATANSNLDQKINSIVSTNTKLTVANSNLDTKIESMKNVLNSFKSSQATVNSNVEQKINSIVSAVSAMKNQGCPEGFFYFSSQCFRKLSKTQSWDNSKAACKALGLDLAQPHDPVGLSNYMLSKFGGIHWVWVNLRGDGREQKWQRTGHTIPSNSPVWWPGRPSSLVTTNDCSTLMVHHHWLRDNPTKVYYAHDGCHYSNVWPLCELVTK